MMLMDMFFIKIQYEIVLNYDSRFKFMVQNINLMML